MKKPSRKSVVVTGSVVGAGVLALAVAGGVAVAVVGPQTATDRVEAVFDDDDRDVTGTVEAPREALRSDDAAEQRALREAATTTPEQAGRAALTGHPGGEVLVTELDEEDGWVVYEVLVRDGEGLLHEVTVDAGDGGVLARELEDDDDLEQPQAPQAPQAPETAEAPQAPQAPEAPQEQAPATP